ncbi:MAG: hypothetical protein JWO53_1280 [Chlamydiia bacterium]|nr:hypothetical protein [Chlamydiia bacterium]
MVLSFDAILNSVEISAAQPLFYERICSLLAKRTAYLEDILLDEFEEISRYADEAGIQESCSIRNVLKARALACLIITDEGEIDSSRLQALVSQLKANLYSLSPGRQHDAVRDEHILHVLELLLKDKALARLIKNMSRPFSNRLAEEMIRDTLMIPLHESITDVHVKRACLAAWLTTLRQSLGSCFATAPAILIHQEQPALFLRDLDEMMNTGRMKKTFGGVEYSVPLASSWGNGDLKKPIALYRDLSLNDHKVWASPGLIAACEAVNIVDSALPIQEKTLKLRALIERCLPLLEKVGPVIVTTAEELLRALLLQHHEITQKNVDEYLNRPKSMIHTGLLMHVPRTSKKANAKGDPCVLFLKDFEVAKTSFKALADCALLKAWEFTLASFAEIKLAFTRFNLYTSLGVNYNDRGGIGECLYSIVSQKVAQANLFLKEKEEEYRNVAEQMRYLDARARQANTEKEIEWMKIEYRSRQAELYHIEQVRQMAHDKASKIARLYEFLINEYDKKFPAYFQEVYDPEIHDIASGPFDDSPAGFRLLYKYGRSNPSQWERIFSLSEFVESLVSFFTITEQEIASRPEIQGIEADFSFVITQLVNHVRSEPFLESAFYRMAKAHNAPLIAKPLQNLDKVEKKPWVYTSGGSMSTLVSAYFKREDKPFEVERWVESETELFAFFIDTLKQLPAKSSAPFLENPDKSMLIHSPTHAFLLKPGFFLFREGCVSDSYTYSWIKHQIVEPTQKFLKTIFVEEEMAADFIKELMQRVPIQYRPRLSQLFQRLPYRLSILEFRTFIMNTVYADRGLQNEYGNIFSVEDIDSLLYSCLPYTETDHAKVKIEETLYEVFKNEKVALTRLPLLIGKFLPEITKKKFISAKELLNITKALSALALGSTRGALNLQLRLLEEFRKRNMAMPLPVLFADTNWVKDYFAFVVNPATEQLELWSVDCMALTGRPLSNWKMWVNGSRRQPQWGIFSRPADYIGS